MGRRSKTAGETLPASALTLDQLNRQISFLEHRFNSGSLNNALRRDAFSRLTKLEAERETLHGIPAPDRHFPRRNSR